MKSIFKITGMNCKSCAKVIKFGLQEEKGVNSVDVDFDLAKAYLELDLKEINTKEIKDKIKKLGYNAIEE